MAAPIVHALNKSLKSLNPSCRGIVEWILVGLFLAILLVCLIPSLRAKMTGKQSAVPQNEERGNKKFVGVVLLGVAFIFLICGRLESCRESDKSVSQATSPGEVANIRTNAVDGSIVIRTQSGTAIRLTK